MIVYAYPADRYGCGWHRILYVAGVLQSRGHDVRVIMPGEDTMISAIIKDGHVAAARCPQDADVVVLQRPTNRKLAEAIPFMRGDGVAVVVDMDDDLAHIHPKNPSFWGLHPAKNPDINWHHSTQACRDATMVTVSTPALAKVYGSHGRVRVLENCVPASTLTMNRVDHDWIGWPGSLHSHPDDLDDVAGALQRLKGDGSTFCVVGDGEDVGKALGLREDPLSTGVVNFGNWSAAVSSIGIGIAPLKDTRFNAAKSWLKPLHMAALGVPFVASDLPEYRRLGTGLLAHRRDWYHKLKLLVNDGARRTEMSEAGREVAATWTYEGRAELWLEAWDDAVKLQQSRPKLALV